MKDNDLMIENDLRNLFSALVSVLPELINETDPKEAMKQLGCIFSGIAIMFFLSFL